MTDEPIDRESAVEHVFLVDPGFASRAATAVLRETLVRPPWTLIVVGLIVLAFGLALLYESVIPAIWVVFGSIVFAAALVPLMHRAVRKQIASALPAGARVAVRYFDHSLWMSTPMISSEMDYSLFDRVRVRGDVALFRVRSSKTYSIAPKQLVPDDVLDRIRPLIERPLAPA